MDKFYKTDKQVENGIYGISVSISYNKGDASQCYHPIPRGYSVHVQPETRVERDGYTSCRCIPTHGYKNFILPVERKSDKAEREAEKLAESIIPDMIARVCIERECKILDGQI